jgi:LysR family transcriptional regulator, transcription activator of glutamate synthase operon
MELLQLKYFQTVANLQHVTKAAEELNITQPSLSIMISRLEDELGTLLFERKGRNIRLNEAGKILLTHVNKIFSEIESAKAEIRDMTGNDSRLIRIATTNSTFLSGVMKEYFLRHPKVKIRQLLRSGHSIESGLKKGEIDLGITAPPIQDPEIEHTILQEEEIVLVVPSTHRFAGRKSIRLKEVESDSFISLAENYSYKKITDNLCHLAGFTPNIIFEVDDGLLHEILQLGYGIALVPISIFYKINHSSSLTFIRISEPRCQLVVGLSWLKDKYLPKATNGFKDFILSYYMNEIRDRHPMG